jgi:hypothetical protein
MKTPHGQSSSLNQRRTDNTMAQFGEVLVIHDIRNVYVKKCIKALYVNKLATNLIIPMSE